MDAVDVGIATSILNAFIAQFADGFERLRPAINFLAHTFLVLDISLVFVAMMFGSMQLYGLIGKLMGTTFWLWLLLSFDQHAHTFVRSLVDVGHIAAGGDYASGLVSRIADTPLMSSPVHSALEGSSQTVRELFNPSTLMDKGFKVTKPLHVHVMEGSLLKNTGDLLNVWIAQIVTMIAFWAIAANAMMALIEYYWVVALSGILLPFVFLGSTRWIAMKPLSMLLSSGVKLMALAFVMTVIEPVLTKQLKVGADLTTAHAWSLVFGAALCAIVAFGVPRFAQGMMMGAGSAGAGEIFGAARSVMRAGGTAMRMTAMGSAAIGAAMSLPRWFQASGSGGSGGGSSGGSGGGGKGGGPGGMAPFGGGSASPSPSAGGGSSVGASSAGSAGGSSGAPKPPNPPRFVGKQA